MEWVLCGLLFWVTSTLTGPRGSLALRILAALVFALGLLVAIFGPFAIG